MVLRLILCSFALLLASCTIFNSIGHLDHPPHLCRYLIPSGYVGWVQINYKVESAPLLPIEDGYYLLKVPSNGVLNTSSDIEFGSVKAEYYYYSGDNRQLLKLEDTIWGAHNGEKFDGNKELVQVFEGFFVGTHDEFLEYGNCCERNPGPIDKHSRKTKKTEPTSNDPLLKPPRN